MRVNPFEAYVMFIAVKAHFNTVKYNYFKFSGKVKASVESYENKSYRFIFNRLAKRYNSQELLDLFVANVCNNSNVWAGDLTDDTAEERYYSFVKRKQAFGYYFKQELDNLLDSVGGDVGKLFAIDENAQYPKLLNEHFAGRVSIETLSALDDMFAYSDKFSARLGDDIMWNKLKLTLKKIRPFIQYDRTKIKEILKSRLR